MAVPSPVDAVIGRLLETAAVTAITSTRISGRRQPAWNVKEEAAIVVRGPQGGPGENFPAVGLISERLDIICSHTSALNAKTLAQLVYDSLIPLPGVRVSFMKAHTKVVNVQSEGGRFTIPDAETGWDVCVLPVIVTYRREAAP